MFVRTFNYDPFTSMLISTFRYDPFTSIFISTLRYASKADTVPCFEKNELKES